MQHKAPDVPLLFPRALCTSTALPSSMKGYTLSKHARKASCLQVDECMHARVYACMQACTYVRMYAHTYMSVATPRGFVKVCTCISVRLPCLITSTFYTQTYIHAPTLLIYLYLLDFAHAWIVYVGVRVFALLGLLAGHRPGIIVQINHTVCPCM